MLDIQLLILNEKEKIMKIKLDLDLEGLLLIDFIITILIDIFLFFGLKGEILNKLFEITIISVPIYIFVFLVSGIIVIMVSED